MQLSFSAKQIAEVLNGNVVGDPLVEVNGFSKIEEATSNSLTFLSNPKYEPYIYTTQAGIVLVNSDFIPSKPIRSTLIQVEDAYSALATLLQLADSLKSKKEGIEQPSFIHSNAKCGNHVYIGAFAYIDEEAILEDNVQIYPNTFVGKGVRVGEGSILYAGVKVYEGCTIGKNTIIHAGAVIGSDGFGFAPQKDGSYSKIPQLGNVVVGDNVEIGANTTVDRAVMGSTVIEDGVKLDNLIQIAHNVTIGKNTAIAAQTGISGSTKIGEQCVIGGQVGLGGHIQIGKNTKIGAQSGIISNTPEGKNLIGSPAIEVRNFFKSSAIFARLPEMYKQLSQIQREIQELKK